MQTDKVLEKMEEDGPIDPRELLEYMVSKRWPQDLEMIYRTARAVKGLAEIVMEKEGIEYGAN